MDVDGFRVLSGELEQKIAIHGKAALLKEFKTFFEKHPEILGVRWTQWTDSCCKVWSMSDFEITLDAGKSWFNRWSQSDKTKTDHIFQHLTEAFSETESLFQAVFQEDCLVYAGKSSDKCTFLVVPHTCG